ncbi:hypothetical protein MJH12_07080, partial [bacterium]|nr:hypothetical protein [bacterium]
MEDYPIVDLNYLLGASRDRNYKKLVTGQVKTLRKFLLDHDLLTSEALSNMKDFDKTTVIMRSDLTEMGFTLIERSMNKWMNAHDRGKNVEDVGLLLKV